MAGASITATDDLEFIAMTYQRHSLLDIAQPDEISSCPACGSHNVSKTTSDYGFTYGSGESAVVLSAQLPVHKCRDCGEQYLDSAAEDLIHEAICRHLGRMPPAEVRAVRERCGLSRNELAHVTGWGEATIGRWERGDLIQNQANDQLLYLLTFPDNVIRLRDRLARAAAEKAPDDDRAPRFRALKMTVEVKERARRFDLTRSREAA